MKRFGVAAAVPLAALAFPPEAAFAHAICGDRVFPVTLTIDDPGVADEASVPTFTYQNNGAAGSHEYDFNFEWDKRITPDLGFAVNYGWNVYQTSGEPTTTGWDNLSLTGKYAKCVSPSHEFMLAVGVEREFGRTGTISTGADNYGSTSPTLYFGKGLGDVGVPLLRPFAVTGEFSYTVADVGLKARQVTDPDTGTVGTVYNSGNSNQYFGGFSVQYSIPYLQAEVKDYGLPDWVGRLTPLVEVVWTSPATSPSTQGTTWTVSPGVIYSGDWYQLGVELLIPANKAAGTNVGLVAQFHLFLDDLLPRSILGQPLWQ
jgi:hypothetical protein